MTSYCRDHDPILAAGFIACQTCGRRAYPADADWFGPFVVATFRAACPHVGDTTWIVDPDAHEPDDRCGALTVSTGEPCRNRAGPDGGPCHLHRRRGA